MSSRKTEHGGYRRGIPWGVGSKGRRKVIGVPEEIFEVVKRRAIEEWISYLESNNWQYTDEDGVTHDLSHLKDTFSE